MKERNGITRGIVLAAAFSLVTLAGCSDDPANTDVYQLTVGAETATANLAMGMSSYDTQCMGCHGAMGETPRGTGPLNAIAPGSTYSVFSALQGKIHSTMPRATPTSDPTDCEDDCADNVAGHIYCAWNTALAMGCPP